MDRIRASHLLVAAIALGLMAFASSRLLPGVPGMVVGILYGIALGLAFGALMRRSLPDVEARIAVGDFSAINDWLRDAIWSQASRWETGELVELASGEALNPAHFRAHLERRYLG